MPFDILILIIFIWSLNIYDLDKKSETDKPYEKWSSLSKEEKKDLKKSPKAITMIIFTFVFPIISCIRYKRWLMLFLCILEWFLIFGVLDLSWELWIGDDPWIVTFLWCLAIRIMATNNIIWVNYNAWYFRSQDNKNWPKKIKKEKKIKKIMNTTEKHTNKIKSKKNNKVVMIILCCFISIIISWCGINWSIQWNQKSLKCYTESWTLNKHPLKDAEWNMVNCYNNIWEQDWKWLYYNDSWQISGIENFKNWELNGKRIDYYDNWQIEEEWFYYNWFNYDWERIKYYYNWKIRYVWHYKNWKENWNWVSYYKNWQINYTWSYKDWKQDWERISYNEYWEIDWKIIFSGWIIVNSDIENNNIIHFWLENFFDQGNIFSIQRMSCYNIYWYQNLVPEKNEDGDIINCYDQNWNMNWKWITYIDTEEIDGIENAWRVKIEVDFLNWKENGNMIFYYENWQIQLSVSYINWIEDGKRISYYENWQIRWEWTNKNWKKDWKEIYYYDNWQIKSESIYKNWKLIK